MSDTPRTDEQINGKPCTRFEILAGDCLRNAAVPSEFARTLERELNAAQERIKRLEAVTNDPHALWANWLRGSVTLPVGIGDVREYQDRIKRLEEALHTLVKMHRCFTGKDDGITHERSYYCFYKGQHDHWKKAIDALESKEAKP